MEFVSVQNDGGIVTVILDRPPVNAVNSQAYGEIRDTFEGFRDDRTVRVVIFTSTGERAFVAGADLKEYMEPDPDPPPSALVDPGLLPREAMWSIYDCAVPVIGAINGPVLGAGVAYAACCDILVAVEGTPFGTPEINVGLLGASSHLIRLVGPYLAREMFFSGRTVPAEELYRRGALARVVRRAELMGAARELAEMLVDKSPLALRLAKESMNRTDGLSLKEAYRLEQEYTNRLAQLEDSAEARSAFFEKRAPVWKMR